MNKDIVAKWRESKHIADVINRHLDVGDESSFEGRVDHLKKASGSCTFQWGLGVDGLQGSLKRVVEAWNDKNPDSPVTSDQLISAYEKLGLPIPASISSSVNSEA